MSPIFKTLKSLEKGSFNMTKNRLTSPEQTPCSLFIYGAGGGIRTSRTWLCIATRFLRSFPLFFLLRKYARQHQTWKDSKRYTPHGAVQRYCCQNCGYHFQRSDICVSLISQAKRISPNGPANHLRTLIRFFPPFMYRFQGFFYQKSSYFFKPLICLIRSIS